jgi:hypothetical protein
MFNNESAGDNETFPIKRKISFVAILATLFNEQKKEEEKKKQANLEQKKEPINISIFKKSLKELFNDVTNLEGAKQALGKLFIQYPLLKEEKKEPINIPTLLVFRESLKSLFNNVTNLDGANKALGELFTQYPLLNPENPSVFKALDEQKGRIFRNFKATTYDMFLSPLKEITSLPTLLAKTLISLMPSDNSPSMNAITPNTTNETQNNKQELMQTIKSWQKILHKTLGALSQPQQG